MSPNPRCTRRAARKTICERTGVRRQVAAGGVTQHAQLGEKNGGPCSTFNCDVSLLILRGKFSRENFAYRQIYRRDQVVTRVQGLNNRVAR